MAKNACSQEKINYLIDYKIKQQKEIKQKPVVQLVKGKHHQMLWLVPLHPGTCEEDTHGITKNENLCSTALDGY